jgi:hypothetical protein
MNVKVCALAAACVVAAGVSSAEAHPYFDTSGGLHWQDAGPEPGEGRRRGRTAHRSEHASGRTSERGGLGPRPRRWCGWWMRSQRGGGPELNVAWNWRHWGSPTAPQVGAVVVWRHHVGEITGRTDSGQWIVRSGNDGGRVRERVRSVAGAVFRI